MSTPDEVSSAGVRDGEIVALYLKWSGKVPGYPCGARLLALAQERGRLTAELGELHRIPCFSSDPDPYCRRRACSCSNGRR
jgi:hypothetical protein